ncbi:MAG: hypothetical protein ACOCV2_02425 [Persicimonas sp.]
MSLPLSNRDLEPSQLAFEVLMVVLVAAAAVPIWLPQWLPLQDLPQHLGAIRVLTDYTLPDLNFVEFFELSLGETQYVGYYGAVWLLSLFVDVDTANRLFLTLALAATPYALRYLLARLERPEYLSLFAFPLLYNVFVLLGFVNFIAAIPLMLLGLGLAVRIHGDFDRCAAIALGVVGFICFFMHVVPFAFLAVGTALVGLKGGVRQTLKRWLPMLPAGLVAVGWTLLSPAGESTTEAVGQSAEFQPWRDRIAELPDWLTNVTTAQFDDQLLMIYGALLGLAALVGGAAAVFGGVSKFEWRTSLSLRLAVLAPLAFAGYLFLPTSYDWIWPISARFGLLAIFLVIPVVPSPPRVANYAIGAALVVVSLAGFYHVGEKFEAFSDEEVGELQSAIDQLPPGKRVAGLIFDPGSRHVRFSPFLHAVAHYQAQKGGAVMFTFADFAQSPFRFREEARPPRVRPRWEWTPHQVDPRAGLGWYDYVLVRGGPGRIARQSDTYDNVFESERWSVWERTAE